MIPAAGVEDQELPITAKRPGVNNPTVARRGNLGAAMGGNGKALLASVDAVGIAKLPNFHAVDRETQMAPGLGEAPRRRHAARVLQGREIGARRILLDSPGLTASREGG